MLFVVTTVLAVALFLLYNRWRAAAYGAVIRIEGGSPSLSLPERLYLQSYLVAQVEALTGSAGDIGSPVQFVIAPGESATAVAANLEAIGMLRNRELFLNYVRYYGLDSQLEAGTFIVDPALPIPELAKQLTDARAQEIALRFLEGWRSEEMAAYLATTTPAEIDADRFLALVQRRAAFPLEQYGFLQALPLDASLEGYLFPDTYRVQLDARADDLVHMMLANFERQLASGLQVGFAEQGLTLHEAVTLASIVERETPLAEERARVAGVFLNRLRIPMRLQADPTVQYALGYVPGAATWWKSPLSADDLRMESPYNTYLVEGLPPGPIANPGLASLQAVAAPEQTEFLYFVADCGRAGAHVFSATYEEHVQNVERCR
ncbi:MAG: endolytic transglycosylase MltG [Anaerolineae bacterium]|nr:endolytic transglycosylase MltG [Anaerolineae bacterium]